MRDDTRLTLVSGSRKVFSSGNPPRLNLKKTVIAENLYHYNQKMQKRYS
jgi:hypothetical protein